MGGGSAKIDPAGVRRMLRSRSMHRRKNDQGTQQGSDPGDPNSMTRRRFGKRDVDAPGSAMKSWAEPAPDMTNTVAKTPASAVQYRRQPQGRVSGPGANLKCS